jgi:hypothetical protein
MHTINKDVRVYLVDRDNNYEEFKSYADFLLARYRKRQWLDPNRKTLREYFRPKSIATVLSQNIGNNWNDTYIHFVPEKPGGWLGKDVKDKIELILLDANFRVINTEKIKKDLDNYVPKKYTKRNRFKEYEWLGFRNGPVPYTRKRRWHFNQYYKRPKTTQERRLSCGCNPYVRACRNVKNLPNSWDDMHRGDSHTTCWKDCTKKKKQWMRY